MRNRVEHWLTTGLFGLAIALLINAVTGPLILEMVTYPFSETVQNQTIGLEAVTLTIVVPWTLATAYLLGQGHRAGPFLAIAPTGYSVYMFAQYIVGPQYLSYEPVVLFHLASFILSTVLLVAAWTHTATKSLPTPSRRRTRLIAAGILFMGVFTIMHYAALFIGVLTQAPLTTEYINDPSMYWSIVLLDLGIVAPTAIGTGIALLRGAAWAHRAAYAVVGWFVLVPVSVAGMSIAMYLNNDPNAALTSVGLFTVMAVVFAAFAAWVYHPLFHPQE